MLFGAMVIEWNKWWSKEKIRMDLIVPLPEADFIALDKTRLSNPYAGCDMLSGRLDDRRQRAREPLPISLARRMQWPCAAARHDGETDPLGV